MTVGPPSAAAPVRRLRSFTLIELLVVLLILMFLFGLVATQLGPRTIHGSMVKSAADQLASVLRKTRQLAMEHHGSYGVSFNIQNAPGSTGAVLNNRSGGHWYRIIGPHDRGSVGGWTNNGVYRLPLFFDRTPSNGVAPWGVNDTELGPWLRAVQEDFIGERIVLPKGQVRFIALMDQDNGNNCTPMSNFGPTYPRPWFGNFVQRAGDAGPRLYAWGGYDPGFNDTWDPMWWRYLRPASVNYSGFYYQGNDQPIKECKNPADRFIIDDPQGTSPTAQKNYRLLAKGEGRPLVNGDWLDCVVLFNPDGTATMADWMGMRHQYGKTGNDSGASYQCYWSDRTNHNLTQLGPGDMCNFVSDGNAGIVPYNNRYEASSYVDATGMYWFTLGSDALDDQVAFKDANAAIASMTPLYRVGVSRLGEVKVIKVRTRLPSGTTLDTNWKSPIWSDYYLGYKGYWNHRALSAAGQALMPAEDFVTADMMINKQWWLAP